MRAFRNVNGDLPDDYDKSLRYVSRVPSLADRGITADGGAVNTQGRPTAVERPSHEHLRLTGGPVGGNTRQYLTHH